MDKPLIDDLPIKSYYTNCGFPHLCLLNVIFHTVLNYQRESHLKIWPFGPSHSAMTTENGASKRCITLQSWHRGSFRSTEWRLTMRVSKHQGKPGDKSEISVAYSIYEWTTYGYEPFRKSGMILMILQVVTSLKALQLGTSFVSSSFRTTWATHKTGDIQMWDLPQPSPCFGNDFTPQEASWIGTIGTRVVGISPWRDQ